MRDLEVRDRNYKMNVLAEIGAYLAELYRRSGQQSQADEQATINARFACAVEALGRRGC